eukprot:TRINITY_DN63695_c0_g1_i1.p1 TRINITY_DN63695_c0_g1~~TRINITY_DN63695_c0_g1_i1.p1  ORF type:complete len:743 (-),score=102.91 TRINITY_DN63695_c0_g1_i1:48-1955(-)
MVCALDPVNKPHDSDPTQSESLPHQAAVGSAFLAISYLNVNFALNCAKSRSARGSAPSVGFYLGAGSGAMAYAIFVAIVAIQMSSNMTLLVVTTDAMTALSWPLLRDCVALGPKKIFAKTHEVNKDHVLLGTSWLTPSKVVHLTLVLVLLSLTPSSTTSYFVNMLSHDILMWPGMAISSLRFYVMPSVTNNTLSQQILDNLQALKDLETMRTLTSKHTRLLDAEVTLTGRDIFFSGLGIAFALLLFSCCQCFRRQGSALQEAKEEQLVRQRMTKLRANSKLFPPPYPNGWYVACRSDDVPKGHAISASVCGKEFVVFRGESGRVAILDAFCPHLGTHLGHGGQVKGDTVVCPYHAWTFDQQGKCVDIPYCSKKLDTMGDRVHTKSHTVQERLGIVLIWLHADGEEPNYNLTLLDEVETKGMKFVCDVPCKDWQMHVMEPSQNAADPYHFNMVHSWMAADPGCRSPIWVRHDCKSRLALLGNKRADGSDLPDTMIDLDEKIVEMRLFGIIPLPMFLYNQFSSGATFEGPGISTFRVELKMLGSIRVLVAFTPQAPFVQRCTVRTWASPSFPSFFVRYVARMAVCTINQDRPVWEHKLNVAPKNVVAGDGPFAAYGMWLRQFYSASSKAWGELSLEW